MSLNRVTVIGHLGQDPQLRFTPLGNPVFTLSVATDESYSNKVILTIRSGPPAMRKLNSFDYGRAGRLFVPSKHRLENCARTRPGLAKQAGNSLPYNRRESCLRSWRDGAGS
jgi:Single-strand binding protein family